MVQSRAALLFDIDGTLADTDAFHLRAFNQVFGPHGHTFDKQRFSSELQGFSMADIENRFLAHEPQVRRTEIMAEKEAVFRSLARAHIEPLTGLHDLLAFAAEQRVPVAAVTNAPRPNAEMVLSGLGLADRFDAVIIGDELEHGKPHPLPYLEGLRLLGADPLKSLAFEDSRSGIRSATAAGIATIGMATSLSPADLIAAGAVAAASDYADPVIAAWIAKRLGMRV